MSRRQFLTNKYLYDWFGQGMKALNPHYINEVPSSQNKHFNDYHSLEREQMAKTIIQINTDTLEIVHQEYKIHKVAFAESDLSGSA